MSNFMIEPQPSPKGGRPRIILNEDHVHALAELGCTYEEIASFFGVHRDTIINNYKDVVHGGWANAKMSLRRQQMRRANEGSDTMLVWLGKQLLGQRDFKDDGAASKQDLEAVKASIKEVLPTVKFNPSTPPTNE